MYKACLFALENSHKKAAKKFRIRESNTRRWLTVFFPKLSKAQGITFIHNQ